MASKLVHKVDPEIPGHPGDPRPLDQFILSIVVDKNGEVQQVEVLQGDENHPPSNSAAADAVKQWRYEPFLLDGKPVPVRTTVFLRPAACGTRGDHWFPCISARRTSFRGACSCGPKCHGEQADPPGRS